MGEMEGRVWRGREGWRLRHITFPQCIKGTGLSVTHTVGMGRGGGEGERERERRAEGGGDSEEEDEEERERERGRGWVWSFLSYLCYFFSSIAPSSISDVIQVTYSSQGGSLPPLPLLSFYLPPPSLLAQLTG